MTDREYFCSNFELFKSEADEIHWFNEKETESAINFIKTKLSKNNTKLIATISSKTDKNQIKNLITSGIRIFNLKCALFKVEDYSEVIKKITSELEKINERPTFIFSLQGPVPVISNIYLNECKKKILELKTGQLVKITNKAKPIKDNKHTIVIDKKIYKSISRGDIIVVDSNVTLKVISQEDCIYESELKMSTLRSHSSLRNKLYSDNISSNSMNNVNGYGTVKMNTMMITQHTHHPIVPNKKNSLTYFSPTYESACNLLGLNVVKEVNSTNFNNIHEFNHNNNNNNQVSFNPQDNIFEGKVKEDPIKILVSIEESSKDGETLKEMIDSKEKDKQNNNRKTVTKPNMNEYNHYFDDKPSLNNEREIPKFSFNNCLNNNQPVGYQENLIIEDEDKLKNSDKIIDKKTNNNPTENTSTRVSVTTQNNNNNSIIQNNNQILFSSNNTFGNNNPIQNAVKNRKGKAVKYQEKEKEEILKKPAEESHPKILIDFNQKDTYKSKQVNIINEYQKIVRGYNNTNNDGNTVIINENQIVDSLNVDNGSTESNLITVKNEVKDNKDYRENRENLIFKSTPTENNITKSEKLSFLEKRRNHLREKRKENVEKSEKNTDHKFNYQDSSKKLVNNREFELFNSHTQIPTVVITNADPSPNLIRFQRNNAYSHDNHQLITPQTYHGQQGHVKHFVTRPNNLFSPQPQPQHIFTTGGYIGGLSLKDRQKMLANGYEILDVTNPKPNKIANNRSNSPKKVTVCEVESPGELRIQSEVLVVGNDLTESIDIQTLGAKEITDISRALKLDISVISACVNKASDIQEIRKIIDEDSSPFWSLMNLDDDEERRNYNNTRLKIFAKIMSNQSIINFDEILSEADGIILNPSFISNDLNYDDLCLIENYITEKCIITNKPLYYESNCINSLHQNMVPSMSDISNLDLCINSGIDGFILNDAFPRESFIKLQQIISEMENLVDSKTKYDDMSKMMKTINEDNFKSFMSDSKFSGSSMIEAMFDSVTKMTYEVSVEFIILFCDSYLIAKRLSKYRPNCRILTPTNNKHEFNFLRLFRGISSVFTKTEDLNSSNEVLFKEIIDYARYKNYLRNDGENIILVVNAYISPGKLSKSGILIREIKSDN